jgi:hypothetical protein
MVTQPYDQDEDTVYTWENYERYRYWFLREYTSKDDMLQPSTFTQWVAFNKAMNTVDTDNEPRPV